MVNPTDIVSAEGQAAISRTDRSQTDRNLEILTVFCNHPSYGRGSELFDGAAAEMFKHETKDTSTEEDVEYVSIYLLLVIPLFNSH